MPMFGLHDISEDGVSGGSQEFGSGRAGIQVGVEEMEEYDDDDDDDDYVTESEEDEEIDAKVLADLKNLEFARLRGSDVSEVLCCL